MDISNLSSEQWLDLGISLGTVFLVVILGRWVIKLLVGRGIRRLVGLTETMLDDAIIKAALGPLHFTSSFRGSRWPGAGAPMKTISVKPAVRRMSTVRTSSP